MIPLQVRMQGWMRYRDEQIADFSGGSLISIYGENGAGKSSIFDAITYALYGRHRLGSVATEELISQDCDALEIEFDFEVAGKRWRVHRGRSRGSFAPNGRRQHGATTQALYAWDASTDKWLPVNNTNSAASLQLAINNILQLSEPAFTSSFLLQQGSSTQFLDAKPAERFQIISSLIDLEAYQQLAEAARKQSTRERDRLDDLRTELLPLTDVTLEAIEAQEALSTAAQAEVQQATEFLSNASARAADAARFEDRTREITTLSAYIEKADSLITRREQIENDAERHKQLKAILETVSHINIELDKATALERMASEAGQAAVKIDVEALDAALAQANVAAEEAGQRLVQTEELLDEAREQERKADAFRSIATAVLIARSRVQAKAEETASLETRLTELPSAQEESQTLSALAGALPSLRALTVALGRVETLATADPQTALATATERHEALMAESLETADALGVAEQTLAAAREKRSTTAANLTGLREQLQEREDAKGEAICSRCGQPVTPEHAQKEIAELTAQIVSTEALLKKHRKLESDADEACSVLRTKAQNAIRDMGLLTTEIARYEDAIESLASAKSEADERWRGFESSAPSALRELTRGSDSAGLLVIETRFADVPARKQAAEAKYGALLGLQGQLDAVRREHDQSQAALVEAEKAAGERLKEVETAAEAYAVAEAGLATARKAFEAARGENQGAREAIDAARLALESAAKKRADLLATESAKTIEATGSRNTATALARSLPDDELREQAINDGAALLLSLKTAGEELQKAPSMLKDLHTALERRAGWLGERQAKQSEVDSIPEGHRITRAEAQEQSRAAEAALIEARSNAQQSASKLASLKTRLEHKHHLERQQESATVRQQRFTKLAQLLGRTGLQGALVTAALTTITSHANSFLNRLTGGSLQLILERGTSNDELNLQAIDTTCMREPRSVHALSGSQKFRCAVALAFGIGQYSGAGGMRSIVIDEGFGSLDEIGQDQMVEELTALALHMDKVIVVSHLEAFRDREHFPFRLQVEKVGNSSVLRRQIA